MWEGVSFYNGTSSEEERGRQNVADISRTKVHRFVQKETLESAKIETHRKTKLKICLVKCEDYEEPDVGVAVLVCRLKVPTVRERRHS